MRKLDVQIALQINFYDNFFIGGGRGSGNIHAYALKDINGNPYIPASALKGCISQCAYGLESFFEGVDAMQLFGKGGTHHGILYIDNAKLMHGEKYKGMEGHLYDYRTGVSISRYTKAKKEGNLRTIETSGIGGEMVFESNIQGFLREDTYQKEVALLISSIRLLFALGGGRSAGMGWLKEPIRCNVRVDGEQIQEEEVNNWIGGGLCT